MKVNLSLPSGFCPARSKAEDACGRPMGIRVDKSGYLVVADAYNGIFRIDPRTGQYCLYLLYTFLSLSGNSGCLTWVRLQQPQEQRYPVLQVHDGSFIVSVIHRTLTWTTGSLTCVCDLSCAFVYTRGLGTTPTTCQHSMYDSEKLAQCVLVLLTGFLEPRVFGTRVRRSTK